MVPEEKVAAPAAGVAASFSVPVVEEAPAVEEVAAASEVSTPEVMLEEAPGIKSKEEAKPVAAEKVAPEADYGDELEDNKSEA